MTWVKPDFYREFLSIPEPAPAPEDDDGRDLSGLSFTTVCKHILRYGFVEVADDILFALLVGVILGGLLFLAIPDNLMAHEYARWLAYPVMVLVGVPLYICASREHADRRGPRRQGIQPGGGARVPDGRGPRPIPGPSRSSPVSSARDSLRSMSARSSS